MEVGIFRPAKTREIRRDHDQHPDAHIGGVAIPPSEGRRIARPESQPLARPAELRTRKRDQRDQSRQIDGQQDEIGPLEIDEDPVREDEGDGERDHDEAGRDIIEAPEHFRDGDCEDRSFENRVIERGQP